MKYRVLCKVLSWILPSAGVVLIIVGYFSYSHAHALLLSGVPARGVVVGYETSVEFGGDVNSPQKDETIYQARIRFQTNAGGEVEFLAIGSKSPDYKVNSVVPVIYNPQRPSDAMLQTDASASSSLAGALVPGEIVLFLGASAFVILVVLNKRLAWFRQNGRRVDADFVRVSCQRGEDNVFYYVICQWVNPDTHQTHQFTSDPLSRDPSPLLAGKTIEVLIDPAKPQRYYVELSPTLAGGN